MEEYTIGLDYGSLSARGVLVSTKDGSVLAECESVYKNGCITDKLPDGTILPEEWVLQNPYDYYDALFSIVPTLIKESGVPSFKIKGIGIATTASTVIPVDKSLRPLSDNPDYSHRPHAWTKMWKHHAAAKEAKTINEKASEECPELLECYGGSLNSEFFLPKVLQIYMEDKNTFDASYTFLELGDYLTSLLTGTLTRSKSYLKSKTMWRENEGYPSISFLDSLACGFGDAFIEKMCVSSFVSASPGERIGRISEDMAKRLGLSEECVITGSQMDAYAGLVGSGINARKERMMVLGTSSAFMILTEEERCIPGMCASVKNGMVKGFYCHAAGQASSGDALSWIVKNLVGEDYYLKAEEKGLDIHSYLTSLVEKKRSKESCLIALDWLNGNKSILSDTSLSSLILGLTMDTKVEDIYRAMIEASAFGARVILERLEEYGVKVKRIVASGGISRKNPFIVQLYADVLKRPVYVSGEKEAAAFGGALYASSACGIYNDMRDAVAAMRKPYIAIYEPRAEESEGFEELYKEYCILYDYFGRGGNPVMKRLRERENYGK